MGETTGTVSGRGPGRDLFATTHWTVVVAAGDRASPDSEAAMSELCRTYWYPLYAYVRRRAPTREDAEDLTQSFLAGLLGGDALSRVSADRGRFRAFLLAALNHFLANAHDRATRLKRGGGWERLSLDWVEAEERYRVESVAGDSPEAAYDRAWAMAVLERVMAALAAEAEAEAEAEAGAAGGGRAAVFRVARGYLSLGDRAIPYAEAAAGLGMDEGALRVAVHRWRKRYRAKLREEIRSTLADAASVEEELQSLRAALGG